MQRYNNTINLAYFDNGRDCQNKRLSCEKLRSKFDKMYSKSIERFLTSTDTPHMNQHLRKNDIQIYWSWSKSHTNNGL